MDSHILTQQNNVTPFSMYIESLRAPNSKRTMHAGLSRIAEFFFERELRACDFPWHELTRADVSAVFSWLQEEFSPATVNASLTALRGVLKFSWRMGIMNLECYHAAIDVPTVKNYTEKVGRILDDNEVRRLLFVCADDERKRGVRDYAMLCLFYATGARISEIVNLDISDFVAETGALTFRETKGWKDRTVFIGADVSTILMAWIALLDEAGPIFRGIEQRDILTKNRLTERALHKILEKRARQADVPNIMSHDFRRTFISKMLDNGVDLVTIANIVGHNSIGQTASYDRRGLAPAMRSQLALPQQDNF